MKYKGVMGTFLLGFTAFLLAICLVTLPETVVHSALRGLKIWWDVVFPSTLPFFIISEILMGFGVAHFLGVLLEPVMRPVFNVPGAGAFSLAMSFTSGYPMGAKLTARLRDQNLITRSEGERLVSFTSTSDPLFMFGAVAVGFFHEASLGVTLVIVHYLSNLIIGFLMRFYDRSSERSPSEKSNEFLILRALRTMHRARLADGRKFGSLLGDAVLSSIHTLLLIGGLIIIFSVIIDIMSIVHVMDVLNMLFKILFTLFGIPEALISAMNSGFFEVTLGAQVASEAPNNVPMVHKIAVTNAILAWSGLSVHAQVASLISNSGIGFKPYFMTRFLHTGLATFLTYLLWNPINSRINPAALPTFLQIVPETSKWTMWNITLTMGCISLIFLGMMILLSLVISFIQGARGKMR